ncbi:MAG: AMP-binding protein [Pseudomonadales bacterium]|nr:AMP-binding protein [Pseudomonadales bacterium]
MTPLDRSYVCSTDGAPLLFETIGQCLDRTISRWPDREALIVPFQDIRWTWREFGEQVDALATGLLALGFGPGDRIGIWSPNSYEWVLTQFATAKIGVIMVCINPAYRLSELEYALNKVECRAIITADRFKTSEYLAMLQELAPELASCEPGALSAARLPHLRAVIRMGEEKSPGTFNFSDVMGRGTNADTERLQALATELQPDDAINIQFTSGTTGSPKGATLTHCNILNNGWFVGEIQQFTEADRLCIPVPLYHCFGMVMGTLNCIAHGAAMILPAPVFDPLATLEAAQSERCTALYGVPTMFIAELDHPEFGRFKLDSLRTGVMAGAPCPVEVMKRVIDRMHMKDVTICYGMTETSPVSFQTTPADPLDKRVETVGRILPRLECKIVDTEGRIVPIGEPGELCTRGYSVMLGYWNDEEKTDEAIDTARWMHTGDIATMDDEGYVRIVGRIKDMLIRGGENIYPREIEEFLYRHPAIQDVQVFGVPDERYGEEVCAWICIKQGETLAAQDVIEFCKGQIAHYKVPRYVRFVESFPMTVTGKIQKFVMRESMIEELSRG